VTVFVDAIGNRWCAAAPDGAAACGIADDHALAEQLGDQLGIRSLAAAGTGARELKQRLIELAAFDRLARLTSSSRKGRDSAYLRLGTWVSI
jgi:hypothetical protein